MGEKTKISWCDSTCNLVMGCSAWCELGYLCFAREWCGRFAGRTGYPKDFSQPELFLDRLDDLRRWKDLTGRMRCCVQDSKRRVAIPPKPWLDGLPRVVFLSDLGEMFDEMLPREWLARPWREDTRQTVLELLASLPHIFIILTKQPARMRCFFEQFPCPPNLWLGVSVTNQFTLWRVDELVQIDCRVRIISHEPATGRIDFGDRLKQIQWLISGGMSGRDAAPCDLAWLRSDRAQSQAAYCCNFFFKQMGSRPFEDDERGSRMLYRPHDPAGADPAEWPADLQLCREVPQSNA